MTIWIDLTNTFSLGNNNQNKVQNFELELIKSLSNIDSSIRFSIYKQNGFEEISRKDLSWALKDDNSKKNYSEEESFQKTFYENYKSLKDAKDFSESRLVRMGEAIKLMISLFPRPASKWIYYLARLVYKPLRKLSIYRANYIANKKFLEAKTVKNDILIHPFKDGDVFFSYDSVNVDKENILSKIKMNIPNLKLVYFVSDAAISKKELQHLFIDRHNSFSKHMEWISNNCDFVLYAGKLTQQDMENYLIKKEMRVPNGVGVELGSNKKKATSIEDYNQLSKKIGLNEPYLLSVGTIEPRKNYKTLYQAYVLLAEKYPEKEIPFLVIVGEDGGDKDLIETIKSHPITKKKIIITQVTKEELDILYQNCMLVLLPSLYESCSAVVTEALSYGKTCICSNAVFLQ